MISDAINRADRLSSCSHRARKLIQGEKLPFSIFLFQCKGGRRHGRRC